MTDRLHIKDLLASEPPFEQFFSGVGRERFVRDYFQQRHLVDRCSRELWESLPHGPELAEGIVRAAREQPDALDLELIGPDGEEKLQRDVAAMNADELLRRVQDGEFSVLLREGELIFPSMAPTVNALRGIRASASNATVFLAAPNAASSPMHYDPVDVIVVGISGEKSWQFMEPFLNRPSSRESIIESRYWRDKAAVTQVEKVGAGISVYVPRGLPHRVLNSSDEMVVHYSLSLAHDTYIDVFQDMLRIAMLELRQSGEWGQALPLDEQGRYSDGSIVDQGEAFMEAVAEAFQREIDRGGWQQHLRFSYRRRGAVAEGADDTLVGGDDLALVWTGPPVKVMSDVYLQLSHFMRDKACLLSLPLDRWHWVLAQQNFRVEQYREQFPETAGEVDDQSCDELQELVKIGVLGRVSP